VASKYFFNFIYCIPSPAFPVVPDSVLPVFERYPYWILIPIL
jgi:hypothetical protein